MVRRAPPDVAAYLAAQPPKHRAALRKLRARILGIIPDATERISYQMPGFFVDGRAIVWIGGFKEHCTLFPGRYRFAPDEELPDALVQRTIRERLAAGKARAAKRPARKAAAPKRQASLPRASQARD